jgi:hypothetical protein
MAPSRIIQIQSLDGVLARYGNQLGALGQGKARVAMARALNYGAGRAHVAVKRALVKQTSIPRGVVQGAVKLRKAAHKGSGALEAVIHATGSELPLSVFSPRQFSFGVRARVWGRSQRFPGMFGAPGDNPKVIAALGGQIFHRTGKSRLPIEKSYGPSIPKEMLLGETKEAFETVAAPATDDRLRHELARMLDGLS